MGASKSGSGPGQPSNAPTAVPTIGGTPASANALQSAMSAMSQAPGASQGPGTSAANVKTGTDAYQALFGPNETAKAIGDVADKANLGGISGLFAPASAELGAAGAEAAGAGAAGAAGAEVAAGATGAEGASDLIALLDEGGTIQPGETAVKSGVPETITANADGSTTVTPLENSPLARPGTPGYTPPATTLSGPQTPQTPEEAASPEIYPFAPVSSQRTAGRKAEQVGVDILSTIVGGPRAALGGFVQQQQYRNSAVLGLVKSNPMMLTDPDVAARVDSILGSGTAHAMLHMASPQYHNMMVARALGIDLPLNAEGGVEDKDFYPALDARGYGYKAGPMGVQDVQRRPATATEAGTSTSWRLFTRYSDELIASGMNATAADKIAAQRAVRDIAGMGLPPEPELRRLALSDTDADVAANKAGLVRNEQEKATFNWARDIQTQRAAGTQIGTAAGRAALAPEGSVFLGPKPGEQAVQAGALQGGQITFDRAGNMIMAMPQAPTTPGAPAGAAAPGGAAAGAAASLLLAKPQQINAANSVIKALDELGSDSFRNSFLSEKMLGTSGAARAFSRVAAEGYGAIRDYVDPAKVIALRNRASELKVQLERMATNGVPRAQGIVDAFGRLTDSFATGRVTREVLDASVGQMRELVRNLGPQRLAIGLRDDLQPGDYQKLVAPLGKQGGQGGQPGGASANPAQEEQNVRTSATKLGVDPDFAARIASAESGFNPAAVSPKGARGTMQVMPRTAEQQRTQYGDNPIDQGVGYLSDLGFKFQNTNREDRNRFVAAAYNAGPSRVMHAQARAERLGHDSASYASIEPFLPKETRDYVRKVVGGGTALASRGRGGMTKAASDYLAGIGAQ